MAIYHNHVNAITKHSGRSVVAKSAYISGTKLESQRDGITYDYTRKKGIVYNEIMLCKNAPMEYKERSILWNAVDIVENGNGQPAKEIDIAIPKELNREEQIQLIKEYVRDNFIKEGRCVEFAIHDKNDGNPHAHILFTVRPIDKDGKWEHKSEKVYLCKNQKGEEKGFTASEFKESLNQGWEKQLPYYKNGNSKERPLYLTKYEYEHNKNYEDYKRVRGKNNAKKDKIDRINPNYEKLNNRESIKVWRKDWTEKANRALEKAGSSERIDDRSLKELGVDKEPQIHVGVAANAIDKKAEKQGKGIVSEMGKLNEEIKETNIKLQKIKNEKIVLLREYKAAKEELTRSRKFFKKFNQAERDNILKAQKVLRRYVSEDNLQRGYRYLDKNISFWNELDNRLSRKMKNLDEANFILSKLKTSREKYKQAPLFSEERKELKLKISELEHDFHNKIQFIEKYHKYGIKDEKSFEFKYSELRKEEIYKRQKYESSLQSLFDKKQILDNAKSAIDEAEKRIFLKSYQEYESVFNIKAASINKVNEMMGRNLSFYEFNTLAEKAGYIKQENEKLIAAEKYLNEYERLNSTLGKYESGILKIKRIFDEKTNNEYTEIQQKMKYIKNNLSNEYFKIKNRSDLYNQKAVLREKIGCTSVEEVNQKESELNNKEYELFRYELRYKQAKDIYDELNKYKQQYKNNNDPEIDKSNITKEIKMLQCKFQNLKVGKEENFEKNYLYTTNKIIHKLYDLQQQRNKLIENVDISKVCDLIIKANNSFIHIKNEKTINEHYEKNNIKKVVNDNEYGRSEDGKAVNGGGNTRDQGLNRGVRGISTEGDRYSKGLPNKLSRCSKSLQGSDREGQRSNSTEIQRNGGSNKQLDNNNTGKLLGKTTGRIEKVPRYDEGKQNRYDTGGKTNDRKPSSQNRTPVFSKISNSIFSSRFKSSMPTNIQNSSALTKQLLKQIAENKNEIKKISKSKEEDTNPKIKPKDKDRER